MPLMRVLTTNIRLKKRDFLVLLIPYLTASIWYYMFSTQMIGWVVNNSGAALDIGQAYTIFHLSITLSIFLGIFFIGRVRIIHIIYLWAGATPLLTTLFAYSTIPAHIIITLSTLGMLFGVGLLAYCIYFISKTKIIERGRIIGSISFLFLLFQLVFLFFTEIVGYMGVLIICISIPIGTFTMLFLGPGEQDSLMKIIEGPTETYSRKQLFLYLTPWLMFNLINGISAPLLLLHLKTQFLEGMFQVFIFAYLASCIGTLFGGLGADWMGRKIVLGVGLVSYGISGIIETIATDFRLLVLAYIASGFTWGIFLGVYLIVVWGDLARGRVCTTYSAIGLIPFFFTKSLGYFVTPFLEDIPILYIVLSNSFLIFLSNIPLLLAQELVPEEDLRALKRGSFMETLEKTFRNYAKDHTGNQKGGYE